MGGPISPGLSVQKEGVESVGGGEGGIGSGSRGGSRTYTSGVGSGSLPGLWVEVVGADPDVVLHDRRDSPLHAAAAAPFGSEALNVEVWEEAQSLRGGQVCCMLLPACCCLPATAC